LVGMNNANATDRKYHKPEAVCLEVFHFLRNLDTMTFDDYKNLCLGLEELRGLGADTVLVKDKNAQEALKSLSLDEYNSVYKSSWQRIIDYGVRHKIVWVDCEIEDIDCFVDNSKNIPMTVGVLYVLYQNFVFEVVTLSFFIGDEYRLLGIQNVNELP